jgi:thiol-disulfide isomerase/thioredoxin
MRIIFAIFFLGLVQGVMSGQETVISGEIIIDKNKLPQRDDTLRLRPLSSLYYPEQNNEWIIKIPIAADGSFSIVTTEIIEPGLYQYDYWWFPEIYLAPNSLYSIYVDALNASNTYEVKSSSRGDQNKYLMRYKWNRIPYADWNLEPLIFQKEMDSILEAELDLLASYELSEDFKNMAEDRIRYDWGNVFLNYLTDSGIRDTFDLTAINFKRFIDKVPCQNDRSARILRSHINFLSSHIYLLLEKHSIEPSLNEISKRAMDLLHDLTLEVFMVDAFLLEILTSNQMNLKALEEYAANFRALFPNSPYLALVDGKLECRKKLLNDLTTTNEQFSIAIYDTMGNALDLRSMLAGLTGQVVFLDIWATWCAPCIAQIKDLKSLKANLSNDDFSIVSISVDPITKQDVWRDVIRKNDWSNWTHYIVGGGFESSILRALDSIAVPTYALIDRQGRIYINFGRPNEHDLLERIRNFL